MHTYTIYILMYLFVVHASKTKRVKRPSSERNGESSTSTGKKNPGTKKKKKTSLRPVMNECTGSLMTLLIMISILTNTNS